MRKKIHRRGILLILICCLLVPELSLQARENPEISKAPQLLSEGNPDVPGKEEMNLQFADNAALLTKEESEELKQQLAELEETTGWDIMAYTTEDTGKVTNYRQEHRGISRLEILLAGIAALAAGGITAGGIIGAYRFKSGSYQYPIEKKGSVCLEKKEDHFVNQFVTHRHIQKESSGDSGGKSTVHTGAGGRSSSGGSRKF